MRMPQVLVLPFFSHKRKVVKNYDWSHLTTSANQVADYFFTAGALAISSRDIMAKEARFYDTIQQQN